MKVGKLYNVFLHDILKRMGRELYSLVSEEWFEYEIVFHALRSIVLVFVYQNYTKS